MKSNKNNNWIWCVIIVLVVIILISYFLKSTASESQSEDENSKKANRVNKLLKEKQIILNHIQKNDDLSAKIKVQSEKLWRKVIRILILLFVGLNATGILFYYLIYNEFVFSDLLTFYSIALLVLNILYLGFTFKLFSVKAFIFEKLKEYSYKMIAGYRDAVYFESKLETAQDRIQQIELEIRQLEE